MRSPWQGRHGPLLIAEIGGNHLGDYEYALKLTDLAIHSGVDYVKFQLYQGDTLVSRVESPDRNQHFKKFELTQEQHIHLAERCRENGVGYTASIWDTAYLDWIDPYMSIYKIGSGDLTAYPVLARVAARGKPILLSTGLSTLAEVLDAVAFLQAQDARYKDPDALALLQCTSMYPIADADANLSVMDTLRRETGLVVGYSDHTEGTRALVTAVAMGAQILEFHFTDRREGQWFRDHRVSITSDEVQGLIAEIETIHELCGDGIKRPLDCEQEHHVSFRRAVYAARKIHAGERLTEENLICLRPNHGIDARDYYKLLNKIAKKEFQEHEKIDWAYLDPEN